MKRIALAIAWIAPLLAVSCGLRPSAPAPPPPPPQPPIVQPIKANTENESVSRVMGAPAAREKPFWLIEPFVPASGWLGGFKSGDNWGQKLADAIGSHLREKQLGVRVLDEHKPDDVIAKIVVEAAVDYVVDGTLDKLDAGRGSMTVTMRLQRRRGDKIAVVRKQSIEAKDSVHKPFAADDLAHLVDTAAGKIADQVAIDIPADLLAARN